MIELKKSVKDLKPYFVNDVPYIAKLDANETKNYLLSDNIMIEHLMANIYPDSDASILREKMAKYYSCKKDNIMIGNGSSDMINTVINGFCEPGDKVLGFAPSFSMYETYCDLAGAEYIKIKSNKDFSVDTDLLIEKANQENPKVVIICNPNNPTGYYLSKDKIVNILNNIKSSIIILDEAYIDFGGESCVDLIGMYENLIIMRTLSKAFGLASLRVGCLITNEKMLLELWKIKMPYNINTASQIIANKALEKSNLVKDFVENIGINRDDLQSKLQRLGFIVYPSKANFLLIKSNIDNLFEKLMAEGILIKKILIDFEVYYRISIGSQDEMNLLVSKLEEII